jgi:phosphate starvation-inducible protein PhoH
MTQQQTRLNKKQRRALREQGAKINNEANFRVNFNLREIKPLTTNQQNTFDAFSAKKNLMLHGIAGTGKSFISLYLSLRELFDGNCGYKKIYIIRSVVPTRDMGFLPGNQKEKTKVYEAPYYAICSELFNRGDAYDVLKTKDYIEFISTSFVRGITLNDCIVIVDEVANMTLHELDSIITRIGKNCRIIFCGDFRQSDFTYDKDKKGLIDFMKILKNMKAFSFVDFNVDDIVRSSLVKEYIVVKDRLQIAA